jgi:peptidoglycan/LPS O-acetylase OafA/YrhL
VTRGEWKLSFIWDVLALSGWPLVWLLGRNTGHVILPFVIVVLYLSAFRGRICSAVFSNRVITDIGGMCYSIYLFHFLIIYAAKHLTASLHIGESFWAYYCLQACMILPCVLIFCGFFFLVVERPCMDREWPQTLWRSSHALALSAARAWGS